MMTYKAGHLSLTSLRLAVNNIARHTQKKIVNNSGLGVDLSESTGLSHMKP